PHSLKDGLPGVYMSEDDFAIGLAESFDRLLAPVHLVLDCLDLYVDPEATPDDFVPWLASWLGVTVNERWSDEQRREHIRRAVDRSPGRDDRRRRVADAERVRALRQRCRAAGAVRGQVERRDSDVCAWPPPSD